MKMPSPSQKDVLTLSPEKEIRNYEGRQDSLQDMASTEDSFISKIKSKIERTSDTHNKENIKYLINIIMEDIEHPLHKEIDKHLECRNDVLDMVNNLRVEDQIKDIMQYLIREMALGKMSSCIYNYAVCKLYTTNEILSCKVKEYFIKSILKDSDNVTTKKSPIEELKMLEKLIDY
ncbi:CRPV-262 [Crowpox virus]|nr:CRPV-262 [Crowpox virus]